MLSINNGYERLSKEYLALTDVSKTFISPLKLAELLEAVMKKIVSVVEQADVGSIMLWDQSADLFQPTAAVGHNFVLVVLKELGTILNNIGAKPLIVHSSTQLEDDFRTSVAGKYDSFFYPNQRTSQENIKVLTTAMARTYARTFNRDLFCKTSNKLEDLVDVSDEIAGCMPLIDVTPYRPGYHIELIMDGEKGEVTAFIASDQ